ncbi:MAG: DUF3105 domain-containing protein [Chloroflexota bacterium]|nr:DUF3105 domain-containing protein [Chloroflexota bacterium]
MAKERTPAGSTPRTPPPAARPTAPNRGERTQVQPRRAERRPEIVRQRRAERLQSYEWQRRQWLITRVAIGAVIALVVGGLAWGAFNQYQDWQAVRSLEGVVTYDNVTREHVPDEVTYDVTPPVGGDHNAIWQDCGFYSEPIRDVHGVHSLEHGAVWITYDPELPQEQIDRLRNLAEDRSHILVTPYPDLNSPVVASAWGAQLELDSANDNNLDAFITKYRQGEQTPEPGALCIGGTNATI